MERLRELAAQVATEQDHDKFMKLVEELNQLRDGEKQERHKTEDDWLPSIPSGMGVGRHGS